MAYNTDWTNAQDGSLQQRIRVAMVATAIATAGESPTSKNVVDEKRQALADKVLVDGGLSQLDRFMFACCAGGGITTASTDAQIDGKISAIWNDMAGVSGRDLA